MPTWLWVLLIVVLSVALWGDIRRNDAEEPSVDGSIRDVGLKRDSDSQPFEEPTALPGDERRAA